jgi:ribosomal protein S12 methylthiotransferase accessory factor
MSARPWNLGAVRGDTDRSVHALMSFVSPLVGLARTVQEIQAEPDDAVVFRYYCEAARLEPLVGEPYPLLHGGSAHYDRQAAIASAVGEVVERYCGVFVPHGDVVWGTAGELAPRAIPPEQFALFAPEQFVAGFPYVPFSRDTRIRWVPVTSLRDGTERLAPVQLLYLLRECAGGEAPIAYPLSSGLACGATYEDALLGGLLELVERDAFMVAWYNGLSFPKLDWRGDEELTGLTRRHFDVPGVEFDVVDLSAVLGVPTALCVVRDADRDLAAMGVGMASGVSIQHAWRKAVIEAFQTRTWARRLRLAAPDRRFTDDHSDIVRFEDRVHFYSFAANAAHAAFLHASDERVDVRDVPRLGASCVGEAVLSVVGCLERNGVEAFARELTTDDVRERGLHVVRALAPQLCPLDMSHKARYLGGPRLREVGERFAARYRTREPFTTSPHPFP